MTEGETAEMTMDESETVYDFNCSVCFRTKGVYSEAVCYCSWCNVYFCQDCHFGCEHEHFSRDGTQSQCIKFDECPRHKNNAIQLYCPKEDVVCCAVCSRIYHTTCGELTYIPLTANGKGNKESLKMAQKDLQRLQTEVEHLHTDRIKRLAVLENSHKHLTTDIKEIKEIEMLVTESTNDQPQTSGVGRSSKRLHCLDLDHPSLKVNQPYNVRQTKRCNVKTEEDTGACSIWGMCQLPDGNFIICDRNNERLKQLDNTYKVISQCSLSDSPCDVCNTEMDEVAVALGFSKAIQFVSTCDTMIVTHSFTTSHNCHSLAYHNKKLYVTQDADYNVYVYTPSGSPLQTISTDKYGRQLLSFTCCIRKSPQCIYVSDAYKGLVTLDLEGNLLATFKPPELKKGAEALCVDSAGNVFVREFNTNNVIQVGKEGDRKVAQILLKADEISAWKICFDNVSSRLLVSSGSGCDHVTVLELAQ